MSGSDFGIFILSVVAAAIVVAVVVALFHWLYLRSSKERSFVRTGLGGQKVVLGGGAFVLPIVHDVIPVNMNTLRLEVARGRDKALITKDRMRVDVISEFYVRVKADANAVADAAQTLGMRTLEPERLKELLEGKFVDALRTAAAEMTMEDLHEKRGDFVKRVRQVVAEDLRKNGLELEAASLTQLDQTAMEFFNPSNAFDAEGLTRLTEQIERRKKQRNDVEQDTMISIRSKNLEAEKLSLDIDREAEYARLTQEREVEVARAQQRTELARERSTSEREVETSQISAREAIEKARIATDRILEEERIAKEGGLQAREIERRQNVELAEQQRSIAVSRQSKAESEARAAADQARAKAVTEEERVFTARETEMAERRKQIDLIEASKEAQREGIRLTMSAEAEKAASADRGHALRAQAQAEADSDQIRTMALRIRHEIEAEGARLMNETHNMLTPEARTSQLRLRLIDKMEGIIRESVKPMERIEGIKILHVDGFGGGNGHARADTGAGLTDSVVNSALRFRAQAPLVDQLLREIGVQGGELGQIAQSISKTALPSGSKAVASDPMIRVYTSSVIDAPADAVWQQVRDFNGMPAWNPGVAESRIEAGMASDRVGCVRNFRTRDGGVIREQLLTLSDFEYECTYSILESPMGVDNYIATLKLTPITDGNRTFAEWSAEFDCAPGRERELTQLIGQDVFQGGFNGLKQRFLKAAA